MNDPYDDPGCPNPAARYSGDWTVRVAPDDSATLTGNWVNTACDGQIERSPFSVAGRKTGQHIVFPDMSFLGAAPPLDFEIFDVGHIWGRMEWIPQWGGEMSVTWDSG